MSSPTMVRRLSATGRAVAKQALGQLVRWSRARDGELAPELWGLGRDARGALSLAGLGLETLLERFGSPLQVVHERRLAANAARFLARPDSAARAAEVYVSYKTNPVPAVLARLHALGLGAEVASAFELWLALRLGVAPADIVYNGPAKSQESLELAVASGVGLVTVNSRDELPVLEALAQEHGRVQAVAVRAVVPGTAGGQFGELVAGGAALETFRIARAMPHLRAVGLHAHYNGRLATGAQVDAFVAGLLAFADVLWAELGCVVERFDVGGNLACPTVRPLTELERRLAVTLGVPPRPTDPRGTLPIEDYVGRVVRAVEAHFQARGRPAPRVLLEPGRALMSDAQFLLCRVVSTRPPDATGLRWTVLDAGINVADALRSEAHQLFAVNDRGGTRRRYRLVGPTCTLGDLLVPACALPELTPRDALAVMDTGAYFVPFSTDFSYPRPAVVMVTAAGVEVARRRERFEDLVALDEGVPPRRPRLRAVDGAAARARGADAERSVLSVLAAGRR